MRDKILSNLIWRFMERIGAQGISFIVQIVLARILVPEYYGMVALVTVFITILQVFVDSGLGNALIQKEDADNTDFSTVFYFNMIMCVCLYVLLFISSPWIAQFYNDIEMIPIIRVVGLNLVVSGIKNVQQAYVARNMLFKKFFFATLGGTLVSAVIGISMAYLGAGVWALVVQQLSNTFIDTIVLWITVKWRPEFVFSKSRFKILFSFGWKLLVSSLINTVYLDIRQLIIGKRYSQEHLAYYNQGEKIPNLVVRNIDTAIGSVMFPALSKEQKNPELVKAHVRRAIKISSYVMWPMLLGISACAESLIKLVLTDKWLPAVPYLQIACFVYGLMPIHTTNLQAITAMGRSDLFLKMEILKKIIGVTVLLLAMPYGVLAIAASAILADIIGAFINAWPNTRLLNYRYTEQIKDIMPPLLLASVMAIIVCQINRLGLSTVLTLMIQIPTGAGIYLLGSALFKLDSLSYLLASAKQVRNQMKK